ncbi:TPA: hypothetical protein ACICB7_003929 [Klebsiella aerogenes]
MTEHVEKYTTKAIEIIADYIQRTNKKNEQLQEAKGASGLENGPAFRR